MRRTSARELPSDRPRRICIITYVCRGENGSVKVTCSSNAPYCCFQRMSDIASRFDLVTPFAAPTPFEDVANITGVAARFDRITIERGCPSIASASISANATQASTAWGAPCVVLLWRAAASLSFGRSRRNRIATGDRRISDPLPAEFGSDNPECASPVAGPLASSGCSGLCL